MQYGQPVLPKIGLHEEDSPWRGEKEIKLKNRKETRVWSNGTGRCGGFKVKG